MTVMIELTERPGPAATLPPVDSIEFIDDLECFADSTKCSCTASDDNPY